MKIQLIQEATRRVRWQQDLATRLGAAGHDVAWQEAVGAGGRWPLAVDLVLELERLVYRRRGPSLVGKAPSDKDAGNADLRPDLVFDVSGREQTELGHLSPAYDGSPDPAAAVAALLDGRSPRIDIVVNGRVLESGVPANENPAMLASGLDAVFARVVDLCCRAVVRHALGITPLVTPPLAASRETGTVGFGAARFALANLATKARARLTHLSTTPEGWRIGYRWLDGPGIVETGSVPDSSFAWLPDDGARYYADPFILAHQGRTWVFCEEFPYATGKGVISTFEIGPDGRAGEPRVVLEAECHLSYPYVFAEGGEVWMIPESSAAGDLALYRAVEFPFHWRRERTLVSDISLSDATPIRHGGRLWLFGALNTPGGSSWDALGLFHGPDLFGEFVAHPLNPVLVDAGAARPAGRMVRHGGHLIRTAQDCRAGYGAGIAIARIDRLDEQNYGQTVAHVLAPPPAWSASGFHTIDLAGGLEVIDCLSAGPPRS